MGNPSDGDPELRRKLARTITGEMSEIIDMLGREFKLEGDPPWGLWRGAHLRLDALVASLIDLDGNRSTAEVGLDVFGTTDYDLEDSKP